MDKIQSVESVIGKGIVAGFVATFLLSALLDPIALLTKNVWPTSPMIGWLLHYFIGTVIWGVGFALLHDHLPGPAWVRGVAFAFGAWVLLMIGAFALAQSRLLVLDADVASVVAALVVHLLYGATLGMIYGWLLEPGKSSSNDEPMRPAVR